eukprot:9486483-Pyramimonas_sp.AAC.1
MSRLVCSSATSTNTSGSLQASSYEVLSTPQGCAPRDTFSNVYKRFFLQGQNQHGLQTEPQ